jgi:5-methylcytosine-specific restriction endonuclease McrA
VKRRNWQEAHRKVADELYCRVCDRQADDAAHVVPRSLGGGMTADAVIPLCRGCHTDFDAHRLDLLAHTTYAEQAEAVRVIGIERARERLAPSEYREAA